MFRKDRIGRRGGGVLLYIKDTIPAYEVQLQEEADCNEAIWCNLVTGHTAVIIGVVYRCPNITKQNNEKIHNAINEVSKGDCRGRQAKLGPVGKVGHPNHSKSGECYGKNNDASF